MRVNGWRRWLAAQMALALVALLVAGCNGLGSIGGGSTSATALPCDGAVLAGGGAPSVTLRSTDADHVATAAVGSVVEIRMDGQHAWHAAVVTPADALTPVGAQGALEHGECVWEYQVAQVGDASVEINGGALCLPKQPCPLYAILATFTIHGT